MSPTRRQLLIDVAIALVLGAMALLVTAHFVDAWSVDDQGVDAYALTLVGIAFASLAVRRRWPVLTLGIVTATTTVYLLEGFPYGPILLAFFVAVYTVASRLSLRKSGFATAVAVVILLSHVWIHPDALGGGLGIIPGSAWAVVPFAIGTVVRMTREANEAARAEALRQQLYDERIRLAQEVHDIVGHGLAAIQMQADVALHVDEQQAPKTRTALESISQASAEAFEELRSTLDLIREPQGVIRTPGAPDMADIEELCRRITDAGVDVELVAAGELPTWKPAIGLAAYRVVQESLTNVVRHGEIPSATVLVEREGDTLHLVITNPGEVPVEPAPGHGISGMRRRVVALGGTLRAGAIAEGFRVEARLPLGEIG